MSETLSDRATRRARIVFDTFRSIHDPRLAAWLLFRSHLLPEWSITAGSLSETTPDGALTPLGVFGVWRLLATNNRELARCARIFVSPRAAFDAVVAEQSRVDEMTVTAVRGPQSTTHGWVIRRGDRPVLTAARWYESASEAAAAGRAASTALATATVAQGVSIGTASGRRARVGMNAP
ncbi:hypothetical protein AB0870_12700 [Microbacterium proteolyticum]|uniref:hypothetical protein n=1 Tax=Microbacterium TaxID=33882 RepID=UPI00137128BF|nr:MULTISPECIES: hypothetical protein [Microbacterium]MDI9890720.1 hypothetical protein [Microbacterium sp. IEGM 1404]